MDDLEEFYLIPVTDIKARKAEKDVTEDHVSDSDVEDATLTKDEGEATTTTKSGKDDVCQQTQSLHISSLFSTSRLYTQWWH